MKAAVITMKNENETYCPIAGCRHTFGRGKTGWFQHVAKLENHPSWHPEISSQNLRAEFFRKEYNDFFSEERRPVSSVPAPSAPQHEEVQVLLRRALDLAIASGDVRAIRVVATAMASLTGEPRTISGIRKIG